MTPHSDRHASSLDGVFARLYAAVDVPAPSELDAETLVAFAEGRQSPSEREATRAHIRASVAARRELQALYPEIFDRLLETPARANAPPGEGAKVLPFRRPRVWAAAGALLTAAAALVVFVQAPDPPAGSRFEVVPATEGFIERGHEVTPDGAVAGTRGAVNEVAPGQRLQLLIRLGQPSRFDQAVRGARAAGALFMVEPDGRARLVCTDAGGCPSSADTLAWLYVAPSTPGATAHFAFVSASRPIEVQRAQALVDAVNAAGGGWDALRARLQAEAEGADWNVLEQPPVRVRP
ncbi:MAG: hypothetical protein H6704_18615 [Myxococcales bacterium]|nr:hypothetical protein [Myxococcales bacterium]